MKKKYITPKTALRLRTENARLTKDGVLCREGLSPSAEPIFIKDGTFPGETDFKLTECYLRRGERAGRVAVITEDKLSDSLLLNFCLIFADGGSESLGSVTFTRNSEFFGRPESFTVFSGEPIRGEGIFLLCRQVYGEGVEDFVSVREYSAQNGRWNLLSDSDFYAPLLLSNGRGNGYFLAADTTYKVSFPAPVYPEAENLISGVFRAEFSSDGASSDFELPLSELSDEPIKAHFSYMGEEAEWQIESGTEYSAAESFIGNRVVMVCDRSAGRISFKSEGGGDFSLPFSGRANNLCVTAVKRRPRWAEQVASASACLPLSGGVSGEKSATTFFYKSGLSPSAGFFNHPTHPLYFPKTGKIDLGDTISEAVLATNGLAVFTREAVFSADRKSSPYTAEDLKKVCDLTLPLLEGSVTSTGDGVCFMSKSGGLYRLKKGNISFIADFEESPLEGGFALYFDRVYLYLSGKVGLVCQLDEKAVCGKWRFPLEVVGGLAFGGKFALLPAFFEGERVVIFPALLSGKEDEVILASGSELVGKTHGITAKCRFVFGETPPALIRLCRLRVEGGGRVRLSVVDGQKTLLCRKTDLHRGKVISGGCVALDPEIELGFSSEGCFSGLAAEYYEI